jgi:hypothetical protein
MVGMAVELCVRMNVGRLNEREQVVKVACQILGAKLRVPPP